MRHQAAQGDDFGTQRAETFDENDDVDEQARHPRIIGQMLVACPNGRSLAGTQAGLVFEDRIQGGQGRGKVVVIHF